MLGQFFLRPRNVIRYDPVQYLNTIITTVLNLFQTMADIITSDVSDRICAHMNDDHAEAIVLYAKAFGNTDNAVSAKMLKIDPQGMDLHVQTEAADQTVRITFDHELKDSEDAHQTLISMVKQARGAKG